MKIAIYPGSFNPWYQGHLDICEKALQIFDKIIIAQGINNPLKSTPIILDQEALCSSNNLDKSRIKLVTFTGFLHDFIDSHGGIY